LYRFTGTVSHDNDIESVLLLLLLVVIVLLVIVLLLLVIVLVVVVDDVARHSWSRPCVAHISVVLHARGGGGSN
jgi:hypothetical protein